jgi:hypothetical protein
MKRSFRMRPLVLSAAVVALVIGGSLAPAWAAVADPAALRAPADVGTYLTNGDHVHISGTKPATASAHGWWLKVSGSGTKARVTVWLQVKDAHGRWHSVAKGAKVVKSGGGSSRRANVRKRCEGTRRETWRSLIDVDIIGVGDSPEKVATRAVQLRCGSGR